MNSLTSLQGQSALAAVVKEMSNPSNLTTLAIPAVPGRHRERILRLIQTTRANVHELQRGDLRNDGLTF